MLAAGRVVAFAPATDLDEAQRFYVDVLGLELVSRDGFGIMLESGAGTIRIAALREFTPQQGTTLGWEVEDVPTAARWLAGRGVELLKFDGVAQDDLGIWTPPGGGAVAWFRDPSGNTLSISGRG